MLNDDLNPNYNTIQGQSFNAIIEPFSFPSVKFPTRTLLEVRLCTHELTFHWELRSTWQHKWDELRRHLHDILAHQHHQRSQLEKAPCFRPMWVRNHLEFDPEVSIQTVMTSILIRFTLQIRLTNGTETKVSTDDIITHGHHHSVPRAPRADWRFRQLLAELRAVAGCGSLDSKRDLGVPEGWSLLFWGLGRW